MQARKEERKRQTERQGLQRRGGRRQGIVTRTMDLGMSDVVSVSDFVVAPGSAQTLTPSTERGPADGWGRGVGVLQLLLPPWSARTSTPLPEDAGSLAATSTTLSTRRMPCVGPTLLPTGPTPTHDNRGMTGGGEGTVEGGVGVG